MKTPFKTPVRLEISDRAGRHSNIFLVAEDNELIADLVSCTKKEARAIERLINASAGGAVDAELKDLFIDSLTAWEDEEESVKEEHAELIARMNAYGEKKGWF